MTIQIPDPGTGVPADKTGDNPWLAMTKVAANFSNQTHAASRLVGGAAGNVMEVGSFGFGAAKLTDFGDISKTTTGTNPTLRNGFYNATDLIGGFVSIQSNYGSLLIGGSTFVGGAPQYAYYGTVQGNKDLNPSAVHTFYTTQNVVRDGNGFLKGASPVVDLYNDGITLNDDAKNQGGITFEKLGTGDYLVKGSLGLAQEGWYIETPKDANGNVLVAVVYEQLANNDISVKTYAKRFDDETGDIVPNLAKPRDIPASRFISLRLHELPKDPPVMPTETQPEV